MRHFDKRRGEPAEIDPNQGRRRPHGQGITRRSGPLSGSDQALITRYVRIGRRPTSFRLEAATWNLLCAIAHRQNLTVDEVCGDIAEVTAEDADLAAAIRLFVLGDIICEQTPIDLSPRNSGS
jgi:predicted DNA-binding ribbon-helix-helix protein